MPEVLLDAAGRPRSPATLPGFHAGRSPRNKGHRYPADPPTVAEIVAVMRDAGTGLHAARLRALIVVLWRAGLRIHEPSRSARPTSIRAAARCSCAAVGAARSGCLGGRRECLPGMGGTRVLSVLCCSKSLARMKVFSGSPR